MTEQDYMDVTDLQIARSILYTMRLLNCDDTVNNDRRRIIAEHLSLMVRDLEKRVELSLELEDMVDEF